MDHSLNLILHYFGVFWKYPLFTTTDGALTPGMIVTALAGALIVVVIAGLFRRLVVRNILSRSGLGHGTQFAIARLAYYLMVTVGMMIVLDTLGLKLSSLAFFGGLVGVGIGFGLQNIASNFISGLILLLERPVRVGDIVTLQDETVGIVDEISMRVTRVKTFDNVMIFVPNSKLIEDNVVNWTAGDQKIRLHISVGVSYGSNPDQVRDILLGVANDQPGVLTNPAPAVWFTGYGDSSLDFELLVWVPDPQPENRMVLPSELRFKIFRAFAENGIEIPFPQRDIHIRRSDAALPVEYRKMDG